MIKVRTFRIYFLVFVALVVGFFLYKRLHQNSLNFRSEVDYFFSHIETLKWEEKWEELVFLAEKLLFNEKKARYLTKIQEFEILDYLISTHFRLGNYDRAKEYAESLLVKANDFKQPELVVNSLYKFSSVLRAEADSATQPRMQERLFQEARRYAKKALQFSSSCCHENLALRARVLFNLAAAECDDPKGNVRESIPLYKEALELFTTLGEEDYRQRTLIRLGKAYLVQDEPEQSWKIIEEFRQLKQLTERTHMHLLLLEALTLAAKNLSEESVERATEGKEIASKLHAKRDFIRFEELIANLSSKDG